GPPAGGGDPGARFPSRPRARPRLHRPPPGWQPPGRRAAPRRRPAHPRRGPVSARARLAAPAALLVAAHAVALGAGFLAPYAPTAQNRALPYAPPTRLHLFDEEGRFHLR